MKPILASLAAALLIAGCNSSIMYDLPYGEETTLKVGQKALYGNEVVVEFRGIVTDSRCPEGVTCVWEGDAAAEFKYSGEGDPVIFTLHTHSGFAQDTIIEGRRISLLEVAPYPKEGEQIQQKDYRVTIRVER